MLHRLDEVPAVHLHQLDDVDTRHPQRDQHLDDQLVARRRRRVGRGVAASRRSSLVPASVIRKPFCGAVVRGVVGLDQAVALEALQRRVHLPGVQRPHLAGPRLELLAQLQPVLRTLAQQRQQGMTDRHALFLSIILSILLHKQRRPQSGT